MRIRYNPEARPELAAWEYYIDEPEKLRGHWAEQFARRQPMVLELGCGKGGFLAQMAPAHPEKNYIALDLSLIHISEPTRQFHLSRMPSSA